MIGNEKNIIGNEKNIIGQQRELGDDELEKVVGGFLPLFNDGVPFRDKEEDSPQDGGATGGW